MAKKDIITLETLKTERISLTLVGTSDLILNKKARSFERAELFKQNSPKGTKLPEGLTQPYCLWEKLCTSVTWEKPIEFFDSDWTQYTEEYWQKLMQENRPCILNRAFTGSFKETFITFYKELTGKTGADFSRAVNVVNIKTPVDFASVTYSQHLTPNNSVNHTNVVAQYNIFSGWSCELEIEYVSSVFPRDTLIEIVNSAGMFIGIGTRRAEGYGRYKVNGVSVIGG